MSAPPDNFNRSALARMLGTAPTDSVRALPVVVAERDSVRFMAAFSAAAASGAAVFLANPDWGEAERDKLADLIAGAADASAQPASDPGEARGWLMIPSGGTGGQLKFARHDEATLAAAVRGFCARFGAERIDAVGVLPLHHVSGLMAWLRCALTGGSYVPWEWKRLERGAWPERPANANWRCLSLVPTQLQRLLYSPEGIAGLRTFDTVFLGGGPPWPALLDAAHSAEVPLALSYGMTETAAMATVLHPTEFRAGFRSCGAPLPHIALGIGKDGAVKLRGDSLFRGYFPDWRKPEEFETEDLGSIDPRGHLQVLGRRDAIIISGGEKVDPAEVEAVLRATGAFEDIAVIGVPDVEWGCAVVACHPASARSPDWADIARHLAALAPFKRPRRFLEVAPWPRNAQGKINRGFLRDRAVLP